jgi:hypothetical protein
MIDVFFCSCARNGLRSKIASACYSILQEQLGLRPWLLRTPHAALRNSQHRHTIECEDSDFQVLRRSTAAALATTDLYLIMDDDCVAVEKNWLENGAELLLDYPEFAALSLRPINCNIVAWTPEGYTPFVDEEVMEHVSVGGMTFMRKGVIHEWPAANGRGYDRILADYIRSQGKRVGHLRQITQMHIGEGFSTVWNTA